jgi:hypothetical protein
MILYSIVPVEIVFDGGDEVANKYQEIEYLGEKVVVSPLTNNEYEIVRIISTSPKSYLDPRLQPGNRIKATWNESVVKN